MKIIKNKKQLKALLNKDKDLILDEDIRIEYQVEKGELRDVRCRDLFLMNDEARFDFTGRDFTGKKISYWAFFNCTGSIKCTEIEGRRKPHAEPVCLDGKLTFHL